MAINHLKVRLKALLIDYLMIVGYLLLLSLIMLSLYFFVLEGIPDISEKQTHWLSFLTTVLPIAVYYTIKEMAPPYQTSGKKKAGLIVKFKGNPLIGSIVRNILKFLPW